MKTFNKLLNILLKVILLIVIIGKLIDIRLDIANDIVEGKLLSAILISVTIFMVFITRYLLKKKCKKSYIILFILSVGFIIRLAWFYNIDSIPVGDFNRMFICAHDFLNGDTSALKDTGYIARFPHMMVTVMYFALIQHLFSSPLLAIRFINILFSMADIVLIYFISKEIFKEKSKSIYVLLISALYPPMIIYNNVYCSENLAIPFLLLSILMFLKFFNTNKFKFLLLSGLMLGISHLFRPIGYVVVFAYSMYIFIYLQKKIKFKIINTVAVIVAFLIPFVLVSHTLLTLNITNNHLWHGTEPPTISMLKGTNIEAGGRWNEEDAKVFGKYDEDYKKVDEAAKKIIKERLTTTPPRKLFNFYVLKYTRLWIAGDFGGFTWSEWGLDEAYNKADYLNLMGKTEGRLLVRLSTDGTLHVQLFYLLVLIMSYIGLYKGKNIKNYKIDLLYIIFCGVSIQCLITESQDRYTYPISWIFIILCMTMFNTNENKLVSGAKEMSKLKNISKLLRCNQWIKNFFVFGVLLFSNNFLNLNMFENTLMAFIAFCCISSAIYILNDIIDKDKDKKHPKKCHRPIASGKVPVPMAILVGILLTLMSFTISIILNKRLAIIILMYLLNNILYSFKIKNVVLLDVFSIAFGFILRVLAGGVAINVQPSKWILLCTLFLSLFLGFGKRRNELITLGDEATEHRKNLSQYNIKFLDNAILIVLACTIVFYAIYVVIGSPYSELMWTTVLVLFGLLRYYYLMYSMNEGGSPTDLVLTDKQLHGCVILWTLLSSVIVNL